MSQHPKLVEHGSDALGTNVIKDSLFKDIETEIAMRLFASSPDCVKLIDLDGKLRFMNANGVSLLELDDYAKIDGQCWQQLWPAERQNDIEVAVASAKSGRVGRFSGYCPSFKGTPKWWDVAISPIYSTSGELTCLLSVSRDISEQQRIERQLRRSEERFRALADNIAQLAWMADASGSVFWYNQRWFNYTGTTLENVQGDGWKIVHHPDHLDRVVAKFRGCISRGETWEDTFPLRGIDGEFRWFLSRAMPMRNDAGEITLWCGTNTDVTEQRQASQRLRQLARLIELSHEAISVRSPNSGILLWNRGCEELYGYTHAEAIGQDTHQLLKTENALAPGDLAKLLSTEGTWSGEIQRTAKDGTTVWVDCRKQVIRLGDDFVVLETDRDITERRKADDVRRLLVSELNHRVKNTLAIVQSFATQTGSNSKSMSEFVASFNGRLQSLSGAHNVLTDEDWSGAGILPLVKSQIDTLIGCRERTSISGPDVFLPPQTALQLTLVLHELATNAVKHGALSVETGKIDIAWNVSADAERRLDLTWCERGGPPVSVPTRRGFGLSVIERSGRLPHLKTELHFNPSGLLFKASAKIGEPTAAEAEANYFNPAQSGEPPAGAKTSEPKI
jgi:PAS domain S-box-containing protein